MNLTLISSAIAAAIAFSVAWQLQSARLSDLRTEYATAQFQALEKAHAQTIALQAKADAAAKQHAARASKMADAADAGRDALARLRNTIKDTAPLCVPSDPKAATSANTDPARELFAQCAGALADLAAEADGHINDKLMLLEAWPD